MAIVTIRLPQMGEGLQEALLVEFLKKPGEQVRRDEPIYVMETDKATTEVESPYTGTLLEWSVNEGTVLAIGTAVAQMQVADEVPAMSPSHPGHLPSTTPSQAPEESSGLVIPPRTRKYLKDKGLWEHAESIPRLGTKLMPEDVDRYLAAQQSVARTPVEALLSSSDADAFSNVNALFDESPISKSQLTLNYRLVRGAQATVPVSVTVEVDWMAIESARVTVRGEVGSESSFSMMLGCVVQTLQRHPRFRSSLVRQGTMLRTYRHVHLGIAVALPEDGLVTAVVHAADQLTRREFHHSLSQQIERARAGEDQADETTSLVVSNIGALGMRSGTAAIVSPAVATLALGEIFVAIVSTQEGFAFRKKANLTLSFDHRIVNGSGAAAFMNDLRKEIEDYRPFA